MGENSYGIMRLASGRGPSRRLWPAHGKVAWYCYERMCWVEVCERRQREGARD